MLRRLVQPSCLKVVLAIAITLAVPMRADEGGGGGGGGGGAGLISPLTRFDAQGRLPQSEAAARAVAMGGPVVAIAAAEAVVLVAPW